MYDQSLLETALKMNGNRLVPMLRKLAVEAKVSCLSGGKYVDYTIQQFVDDWDNGGKQFCETKWRTDAFSLTRPKVPGNSDFYAIFDDDEEDEPELFHGEHEWIPTNMLGYVVENGLLRHNSLTWLVLADALRTPTASVVVHPSYARYPSSGGDPFGLTGHVEAIFIQQAGGYKGRTKAQKKFHDDLRGILKTHLSKSVSDPGGYVSALQQYIAATFWQGDIVSVAAEYKISVAAFSASSCPYFYKSASGVYGRWGATMGGMAEKLRGDWINYNKILENVGRLVKYT